MKKKTRTILFILVAVLFLVLVPIILGYSQGYRFDFEKKSLVKTGGIYLKVYPSQVKVYLNDKFKGQTGIIGNDILIQNLLPKTHKIKLEKEGYYSWEKNLEVKEKIVEEAKNVILFPQNLNFELVDSNVENFYELAQGFFLIVKTNDFYILTSQNEKKKLEILAPFFENLELLEIFTFPENFNVIFKVKGKDSKIYYYLFDSKNPESSPKLLSFLNDFSKNLFFDKKTPDILYFQEKDKIKKINLLDKDRKEPKIIIDKALTYFLNQNFIYYLNEGGQLLSFNLESEESLPLLKENIEIKNGFDYQILKFNGDIFIKINNGVYLLKENNLEKIFDGIKTIIQSPDSKKLLFLGDFEIWLLIQKEIRVPFLMLPQEKLFLARFSQEIKNQLWIQDDYFLFTLGNKIKVSEIDTRSKINIIDLAEFNEPKILFDKNRKTIFVLSEGNLYISGSFLP